MIRTKTKRTADRYLAKVILACVVMCAGLTACGSRRVKDQPPFVQVTAWRIDGNALNADLRIRNVNDEPLPVAGLTMTVDLDDTRLVSYEGQHQAEVAANGFETLHLEMQASDAGVALLAELQDGQRASLPYAMDGRVRIATGQSFRFDREGHIYTVPGKPGQFR